MANILECGKNGMNVKLIGAMPRASYVDIAGKLTWSESTLNDIVSMEYNPKAVERIVGMNHLATTEFDYFVFAVEGLSRVTEVQLVRKRLASYLIKSGRGNKNGRRSFDVIKPSSLNDFSTDIKIGDTTHNLNFDDVINIVEDFYESGVAKGLPEEDLRYIKPQGTEWKGLIAMNGHALLDWFKIRCCKNAQHEIRGLAYEMLKLAKEHSPELFKNAGASCKVLGYCPENEYQHKDCKLITHKVLKVKIKELS